MELTLKDIQRFYSHIQLPHEGDGCWEFDMVNHVNKYGAFGMFSDDGRRIPRRAHIVSWRIFYGKWPTKLVLHKCDNKPCVRPDHLFEGTNNDNTQDALSKGRIHRGEDHHNSKLTSGQVKSILKLIPYYSQIRLAKYFGVHRSTIYLIGKRRIWKHIEKGGTV